MAVWGEPIFTSIPESLGYVRGGSEPTAELRDYVLEEEDARSDEKFEQEQAEKKEKNKETSYVERPQGFPWQASDPSSLPILPGQIQATTAEPAWFNSGLGNSSNDDVIGGTPFGYDNWTYNLELANIGLGGGQQVMTPDLLLSGIAPDEEETGSNKGHDQYKFTVSETQKYTRCIAEITHFTEQDFQNFLQRPRAEQCQILDDYIDTAWNYAHNYENGFFVDFMCTEGVTFVAAGQHSNEDEYMDDRNAWHMFAAPHPLFSYVNWRLDQTREWNVICPLEYVDGERYRFSECDLDAFLAMTRADQRKWFAYFDQRLEEYGLSAHPKGSVKIESSGVARYYPGDPSPYVERRNRPGPPWPDFLHWRFGRLPMGRGELARSACLPVAGLVWVTDMNEKRLLVDKFLLRTSWGCCHNRNKSIFCTRS